jgi:hypothetical protein
LKVQRKEPLIMGRWGFADGKNDDVMTAGNVDIQNGTHNVLSSISLFSLFLCNVSIDAILL